MSWRDDIKKEKFQGPKQKYADFTMFNLGLDIMFIDKELDSIKKVIEDFMEVVKVGEPLTKFNMRELKIALLHVSNAKKEIDEADAKLKESAKYSLRVDSDNIDHYSAKFKKQLYSGD